MSEAVDLVIIGAGRHGREVEAYLRDLEKPPTLLGFIDEVKPAGVFGTSLVLGALDALPRLNQESGRLHFITAAGDNAVRRRLALHAEAAGVRGWTLIHPSAHVGPECTVGAGSCLAPGTILTRNVRIGAHCIVNVGTTVSHDAVIADYVSLNPGVTICGDVEIGAGAYIGAGATVIDKISIGEWTTVGGGAVVVAHLPAHVVATGVPARVTRQLTQPPHLV